VERHRQRDYGQHDQERDDRQRRDDAQRRAVELRRRGSLVRVGCMRPSFGRGVPQAGMQQSCQEGVEVLKRSADALRSPRRR
jgi:hypothetical protein